MGLSPEDRARLGALARSAVAAAVTHQPVPQGERSGGILGERRGCFVTLTNAGRLRGCIGIFQPHGPLAQVLPEMAEAAATGDMRFFNDPITPAELPSLTVEVSILSELQETADPADLAVGTHGIYIVRGGRSGCFLPEVATEAGWNAEQFLDNCCTHKACLPAGAWRQGGTKVYLFTSEKFQA